ncbi:phosphatase PAP2 family protein (plasmid) [Mycolicibacterium rufum]|uniref:Phosphatase PAP2 family protein n=2 Tax=Mycobacteriaceae TaxID=1762 RepID=A0A9X3BH88_9MYCO|nr:MULTISPECIES: phosphatase PAP2 family protein [Mycolicibacterium]MCV7071813.1 phosphatase PAP2 family protein [Mycolicibacterium rufum]MCX2715249.1 phosphatase PAP2 family protein [Mycolicibacterium sp. J2]ULP40031.1 phosphatase PAP2 family protein [Mycolicibacterium rufum]
MNHRAGTPRALGVLALLSSLYVGLGLIAHHVVTGTGLDHAVLGWMVAHRNPALTSAAIAVTQVGSPVGIGALTILASASLAWHRRSVWPAIVIVATVSVAGAISTATKAIVGAHRPPPSLHLVLETDPAFPSGHVTGTLALLGALAVVIGHHVRTAARAALITVAVAGTAAVALTRAYLGVHWATDILAGLLLGAIATVAAHIAYRHLTRTTGIDDRPGASSVSGPIHTVGA